jgi:alanyl-tRNA synthetase
MKNLPIHIYYLSRSELKQYPIRKFPDREGSFRIIEIDKYDYTACGGTHCGNTGEVGLIKIIGTEKIRKHLRVTFLTGKAALDDYRAKHDEIIKIANNMTCHFSDSNKSVNKILQQNAHYKKEITILNKKLLPMEVNRLSKKAIDVGSVKLVTESLKEKNPKYLSELASVVSQSINGITVLACGDRIQIAVPDDYKITAKRVAKLIMEKYEGRGGGSKVSAQIGSISPGKAANILKGLTEIIRNEINE